MSFPPDDWLKQQYEQGRKYSGTETANPWKRETNQFRAWDEGFRGIPFSLGVPTEVTLPDPVSQKPARPAAGRLFD